MIKNYIRIAWRILTRNKVYASINVLGLALGICACTVIYLIAAYEFGFDNFHRDKKRIYTINSYEQITKDDPEFLTSVVAPSFVEAVRTQVPGIETLAPYHVMTGSTASIPGGTAAAVKFDASPVLAGPEYFSIMQYKWLAGNPQTALANPFSVVLTAGQASRYFGASSPDQWIGKALVYEDSLQVSVTGILQDWTQHSDFRYNEFISFSTIEHSFLYKSLGFDQLKGFPPNSSRALLKLAKGIDPGKEQAAMTALYNSRWKTRLMPHMILQPLTRVHFAQYGGDAQIRTAHLPTLYALISIALFILLLAVINYVNLATAQSIGRDKEISIRKVLGSSKANLVFQFLSETFLLTLFAVVLASLTVNPVLTAFRSFIPAGITFDPLQPATLAFLLSIVLATCLMAGLYPARLLASNSPALSLKGTGAPKGGEKWWLRKGLIVFQFTISLIFIIGTVVISRQISYIQSKDLGFTSDAVIDFNTSNQDSLSKAKLLAQKIRSMPGIIGVARENMPPMGEDRGIFTIQYLPRSAEKFPVEAIKADENYIPLYGMKLLAGRNLQASDTIRELVINESLSKLLGFSTPDRAIGQVINTWNKNCPIVGVVADFHKSSFHQAIKPLLITAIRCTDLAVRLNTKGRSHAEVNALLARIEMQFKEVYPHLPFEYSFVDDEIAQLYKKERTTAWLMDIATAITIFISCMGLFGLTMFTAEKRTREIGIRKVLGASVPDIVTLLSRDFIWLVLLAFVIASPIAGYWMHRWLDDFAYRIPLSGWLFAIAGAAAIFLAIATISYQAIKAARANPVKSLRTE